MIIADTSIWADHFRGSDNGLLRAIVDRALLQHPFVTGELVLGNPPDRQALKAMLDGLPQAEPLAHEELLVFALTNELGGTGIGYVDTSLIAAAKAHNALLWTRDKRLLAQAERLDLAFTP